MKFLHLISRQVAIEVGLKYYFTGLACKNGHFDLRRVDKTSCVSCLREYNKTYAPTYYKDNRDYLKEKSKAYYKNNTELVSKAAKAWQKGNPNYAKEYRKLNAEKYKAYNAKRRARLRNAEGSYTGDDIKNLLVLQEGKCVGCGGCLELLKFHVDHKNPLSKGGSNWPDNIQLLCPDCNFRKGAKDYKDWIESNGIIN